VILQEDVQTMSIPYHSSRLMPGPSSSKTFLWAGYSSHRFYRAILESYLWPGFVEGILNWLDVDRRTSRPDPVTTSGNIILPSYVPAPRKESWNGPGISQHVSSRHRMVFHFHKLMAAVRRKKHAWISLLNVCLGTENESSTSLKKRRLSVPKDVNSG